jgi:hypothetical protein
MNYGETTRLFRPRRDATLSVTAPGVGGLSATLS